MPSLEEILVFTGMVIVLGIGVTGWVIAFWAAIDWTIGKLSRYVKAYALLIEFAFYYKDFKKYLTKRKSRC